MIENEITHHIQKYILDVLLHHKTARFKDLRKPGVDNESIFVPSQAAYETRFCQKAGVWLYT